MGYKLKILHPAYAGLRVSLLLLTSSVIKAEGYQSAGKLASRQEKKVISGKFHYILLKPRKPDQPT